MALRSLPDFIRTNYQIFEWKHASAVLESDFPSEWKDIIRVLTRFRLTKKAIETPGGGRSPISKLLDDRFHENGWRKKRFETKMVVDRTELENPTHEIDCYKNRVALEVEWNNKDPFYDRDLNNFRVLFDMRAISAGVIITRSDELQDIFDGLGKGASYGPSTTHLGKLLPRIEGGGGGGCPLLVIGITKKLYVEK